MASVAFKKKGLPMANYISADNVFLHCPVATRDELLEFVAEKAVEQGVATDKDALVQAFLDREATESCGLVSGVAVPHAKCASVTRPCVMVVRSDNELDWETMDHIPVRCAVAIMVPDTDAGTPYLRLLAKAAVMLMDDGFVARVRALDDPAEVAAAVNRGLGA